MVDGPFRLARFTTAGFVKVVPDRACAGSPRPRISALEELPSASGAAEFNALRSGAVTVGYLPVRDLGQDSFLEAQRGYRYHPRYAFGFNHFAYHVTRPTVGPWLRQLHFRQAFPSLVDQPQYLHGFMAGIGTPTVGPAPTFPAHSGPRERCTCSTRRRRCLCCGRMAGPCSRGGGRLRPPRFVSRRMRQGHRGGTGGDRS